MGARFVRLGIAGFKSFADPTTLEIMPGLTGIVGPNGCGKSNVAEALRWAMGEANPRSLRGAEMDDVIFAGAANRPSRNLAEVTLTLEDDAGGLPPPFAGHAEVQVIRRIERGAGSAYRVNGREARARDVQTLFADLASGARSSAMVSQGRVGALVAARPEERRAVLEEAAGITGLHARRAEAETRLRAAETNIERADDRRVQLDRQRTGLLVQAKQAERYRKVTTDTAEAEASLLALQRARAQQTVSAAEQALADAKSAMHRTAAAAGETETESQRHHAALPTFRDREASDRTALEQARLALAGAAGEAAHADAALLSAQQRKTQLRQDLAHAETILQDADAADARLVTEAEALADAAAAHPALLAHAVSEAAQAADALQQADAAASDAATQATEALARVAALQRLLTDVQARADRAEAAQRRLATDRHQAIAAAIDPANLAAATTALASAKDTAARAQAAQHAAEAERNSAAPLATAARDAHGQAEAARQTIAAQVAALAEVLSVQNHRRWPPMVDRLHVPPGLEAALGASLGEDLAAAADPDAPRHWRHLPPLPTASLPGQRLTDLVQAPELLDRALSAVALVDSDASGAAGQASLQPGQSLVSATGGIWRWDGFTIRSGAPTAAAIRLQQRNRLAALQARLAIAEQEANELRVARNQAEQAERAAIAAEQQSRIARSQAETELDRTSATAQSVQRQSEAAAARLAALNDQFTQLAPEAEAAAAALLAARQESAAIPDATALRTTADQARAAVVTARTRDSNAARALDGLVRADQARQTRAASIIRERQDRRMRAADLVGRTADLQARVKEADREETRLAALPAEARNAAAAQHQVVINAGARHRDATTAREAAEQAAATAAAAARTAEHAAFAAREDVVRAESAHNAAVQLAEAVAAHWSDREAALPPTPPPTDLSAAAEDRARTRLARLTRERDDIGPVNLRADVEARAIEHEIATIIHEQEELGAAIAKLRGSIGHLNREGRERLTAVFQQVDRHFQALFGRMFGGGRAHLAMVGSDDPLLAGLEIYAQPPGKKLAALSLLSGGEQALTALSLIFAIFLRNPAPLCVLDEVDAPLDDANVQRFCALLTDMAQQTGTRFLVVTHHQLTMAQMDRLYGVTMQERGVSRLISVDLSLAVGMLGAVAAE